MAETRPILVLPCSDASRTCTDCIISVLLSFQFFALPIFYFLFESERTDLIHSIRWIVNRLFIHSFHTILCCISNKPRGFCDSPSFNIDWMEIMRHKNLLFGFSRFVVLYQVVWFVDTLRNCSYIVLAT